MRSQKRLFGISCIAFFSVTGSLFGASHLHAELTAQQIVENVHFARQKLVSGRFKFITKKWEVREGEGALGTNRSSILGEWSAEIVFDFAVGKSVMDYEYKNRDGANVGHRFVSAEIDGAYWFYDGRRLPGSMHIMTKDPLAARETSTSTHPALFLSPVDPRAVGLTPSGNLAKKVDLDRAIERMEFDLATGPRAVTPLTVQVDLHSDQGDSVRLVQLYHNGLRRRSFLIDAAQGFTGRRLAVDYGQLNSETDEFEMELTSFISEPAWILKEGVWVPLSISETQQKFEVVTDLLDDASSIHEEDSPPSTKRVTIRTESSFEWLSVNEPIDSEKFDYQNFGLPANASVVDRRGLKAEYIDRIKSQSEVTPGGWGVQAGLLGTMLVVIVAGYFYWRR